MYVNMAFRPLALLSIQLPEYLLQDDLHASTDARLADCTVQRMVYMNPMIVAIVVKLKNGMKMLFYFKTQKIAIKSALINSAVW